MSPLVRWPLLVSRWVAQVALLFGAPVLIDGLNAIGRWQHAHRADREAA